MWKQGSDISFRLHANPGFGPLALHGVTMAFLQQVVDLLFGLASTPGSRIACGDVLEGAWVISVQGITSVGKNFG